MNGVRYEIVEKSISKQEDFYGENGAAYSFNVNYWYANSISWDPDTSTYKLDSPYNATNGSAVSNGVRPAISHKKGIEYSSGDGSMTNPYIAVTK